MKTSTTLHYNNDSAIYYYIIYEDSSATFTSNKLEELKIKIYH